MKNKISIEISQFTGIEEVTPEVVYLPFETAYEHPFRKFHENAWSAAIDGEIVLVDENLESLLENLKEMVLDLLTSEETDNGHGGLPGDYLEEGEELESEPDSEENCSLEKW